MYILSEAATVWYLRVLVSSLRCIQKKSVNVDGVTPADLLYAQYCKQIANRLQTIQT